MLRWLRSVWPLAQYLGSDALAGGAAGLTAGALTYPIDLMRTRHAVRHNLHAIGRAASGAGGARSRHASRRAPGLDMIADGNLPE